VHIVTAIGRYTFANWESYRSEINMSMHPLAQLVIHYTDHNMILWDDLDIDCCSYTAHYDTNTLTVYCCQNAAKQRTLHQNNQPTTVNSEDVYEICKAIQQQKRRLSDMQNVTNEAIVSLIRYRDGATK